MNEVKFTGSGSEYFRIWIVNLLLSILTLGIYSAWAKVRRLKYFSRHTELAGARFDYHGDPVAILKGRIVAIFLLIAYQYAFEVSLTVGWLTLAALAVILPWLLRNSFRFRMHYTSYRGIRFGFHGSLAHAYYVFLAGGIASLVTLYTLAPLFHQRLKQYQHGNASFGQTRFSFFATPGAFYRIYLTGVGILLLGLIAVGFWTGMFAGAAGKFLGAEADSKKAAGLIVAAVVVVYGLLVLFIAPYFAARIQNLVWNSTRLGEHRFASTLSVRRLFWIYLTNLVGVAVTLGFFMPWAAVRLARYKAETFAMLPASDLDEFFAGEAQRVGAAGQETAEFFDIDIAL